MTMKTETQVTISCDNTLPLEERLEILVFMMIDSLENAVLVRVEEWNLVQGVIRFIKRTRGNIKVPSGEVKIKLEVLSSSGNGSSPVSVVEEMGGRAAAVAD